MKSKRFFQLITLVLALFVYLTPASAAQVAEAKAEAWTSQTGYKLIEALGNPDINSKYLMLDNMFENDVDTLYLAKFVLGRYWKDLDDSQKETYINLFKRYVLSLYKTYPLDFSTDGLDFVILSAKINGNYTDVYCRINLPDDISQGTVKDIGLEFKLSNDSGKIKIVDLKIGESSLLLTYRSRFNTMVKEAEEDMSWFLEDFELLVVSTERHAKEQQDNM